jgi:DUF3102 family protein
MIERRRLINRSLDVIAADIHQLQRNSIFDTGDLLIEAKDQLDHGRFLDWLDSEFDWSHATAANYMNAARLAAKFLTVRNLPIPARVLYELDPDDEDLPKIIAALEKACEHGPLKVTAAEDVIRLVRPDEPPPDEPPPDDDEDGDAITSSRRQENYNMPLMFEFEEMEDAEAFAREVKERFGLGGRVYNTEFKNGREVECCPWTSIDRWPLGDDCREGESKVEALAEEFGGEFFGT